MMRELGDSSHISFRELPEVPRGYWKLKIKKKQKIKNVYVDKFGSVRPGRNSPSHLTEKAEKQFVPLHLFILHMTDTVVNTLP